MGDSTAFIRRNVLDIKSGYIKRRVPRDKLIGGHKFQVYKFISR